MSNLTLHYIAADSNQIQYTINKGKKVYSRKIKPNNIITQDGFTYQIDKKLKCINQVDPASVIDSAVKATPLQPMEPVQSEFPINQRFEFLDKFTNMVLDKITASVIVSGEGGLGKTHTVMSAFAERSMVEDEDYVIVKGYATPKALYATLFYNKNKTIVFDDCDSVLKDPTAVNLLKGALDSYEKRTISWLTKGFVDDELPRSFEFKGQIIFISNMRSEKMDGAVKSRSIVVDLSMSLQDKIERMRHIIADILPTYPMELKIAALDFIALHAAEAKEFNLRTLQKATKVIKAYGIENEEWKDAVKYLLVSI